TAQLQNTGILNEPPDISKDFENYKNTFYVVEELASFDPKTATGTVKYNRYNFATRQAFNNMLSRLEKARANEFPTTEYAVSPELPFRIQFVTDRTIRLRMSSGPDFRKEEESLMLVNGTAPSDMKSWK